MSQRVRRLGDVEAFEAAAGEFMRRTEAEHNLLLGICANLRQGAYRDNEPYFAVVEEDEEVLAAALRTPPYALTISPVAPVDVAEPLVEDHLAVDHELSGVLTAPDVAAAFGKAWSAKTGRRARRKMSQRIHCCGRVVYRGEAPGEVKRMTADDRDVVERWIEEFHREATGDEVDAAAWFHSRVRERDDAGAVVWWDAGRPVSIAGFSGPTPNGIRVAPVYTPPNERGRGYATACVGYLTHRLLSSGRRFCFLFTDLANPTSNAIYRRIGYEPVCDVDHVVFS